MAAGYILVCAASVHGRGIGKELARLYRLNYVLPVMSKLLKYVDGHERMSSLIKNGCTGSYIKSRGPQMLC